MSRFKIHPTALDGLALIQRTPLLDPRGFFERFFCSEDFRQAGMPLTISQINHTLTVQKGAVRGLHFQHPPCCEVKVVSCLKGEVFDVAVDIRRESPTFLQWHGEILNERNFRSLWIPEGFAHGFQALSDNCELVYLHSAPYAKEHEDALHVSDPKISIQWPLAIAELSDRDRGHAFIGDDFEGIIP